MSAPRWLDTVLAEFGASAGIAGFGFGSHDTAALRFASGVTLRFEYAFESLVVSICVPSPDTPEAMQRLLGYAHYALRRGLAIRTAFLAKTGMAFMATRLPEREVTLPALTTVFTELWHLAEDYRNRLG